MRNYIILNDVNSNTINGLLIQELPPISKPKMRTQIEEIDGRAGDIVTQLGYAAYTKTISVGLYGDFDINEVISYFNSSGTVVFSNEPDKYYNYEIIDQIDFNRLVRFRTAKVKMHVQPFKYPTEEEPLVAQYQLVTNTGSDMSLDNTANALFRKLNLKGNTSQTGTPTPDAPVNVDVVSGDNVLSICGKNLFDLNWFTYRTTNGITATLQGDHILLNGTATSTVYINYDIPTNLGTTTPLYWYVKSDVSGLVLKVQRTGENDINITTDANVFKKQNIANSSSFHYKGYLQVGNGVTLNNCKVYIDLRKDNLDVSTFSFEPYISSTYPIYLGVENLFSSSSLSTYTFAANSNESKTFGQFDMVAGTTYYISYEVGENTTSNTRNTPRLHIGSTNYYESGTSNYNLTKGRKTWKFDCTTTGTYDVMYWVYGNDSAITISKFMISTKPSMNYYAYGTTPIELCKIGDNQDYLYKENGTWYLYKEIGKVVLKDIDYSLSTTLTNVVRARGTISFEASSTPNGVCNGFVFLGNYSDDSEHFYIQSTSIWVFINKTRLSEISDTGINNYIKSNNFYAYYPLATPTTTEITDEDLIAQLEATKQASSYDGQTNISHEYNGSPFILDVAAVQKGTDTLVVDNEGNIYARPTLDIEGTGMVNVYLEGNQMFQVDLSENNEIVIDTDEMEAYDPSTQALMNRQVTGNYDNFKIVAGNNNLKFSGDLTKATVTNYERWL